MTGALDLPDLTRRLGLPLYRTYSGRIRCVLSMGRRWHGGYTEGTEVPVAVALALGLVVGGYQSAYDGCRALGMGDRDARSVQRACWADDGSPLRAQLEDQT